MTSWWGLKDRCHHQASALINESLMPCTAPFADDVSRCNHRFGPLSESCAATKITPSFSGRAEECLQWVRTDKTHSEHNESAFGRIVTKKPCGRPSYLRHRAAREGHDVVGRRINDQIDELREPVQRGTSAGSALNLGLDLLQALK